MSVTCYPSPGKRKALKTCKAFADGCHGRVAPVGQSYLSPGPAFFYGWTSHTGPLIEQCRAEGRDWYYADNAYYFGRTKYYRVTKGALMLNGGPVAPRYPRRWAGFGIDIAPWRETGGHIVIATQSELHYEMHLAISRDDWVAGVVAELKRHTGREIVVCHKPPTPWPDGTPHAGFDKALPGAHAVVSHTSSCMVKALLEGVPVISLGPSMVSRLAGSELACIEDPPRPKGRRALMELLASNQWARREMSWGLAWRALQGARAVAA